MKTRITLATCLLVLFSAGAANAVSLYYPKTLEAVAAVVPIDDTWTPPEWEVTEWADSVEVDETVCGRACTIYNVEHDEFVGDGAIGLTAYFDFKADGGNGTVTSMTAYYIDADTGLWKTGSAAWTGSSPNPDYTYFASVVAYEDDPVFWGDPIIRISYTVRWFNGATFQYTTRSINLRAGDPAIPE